MGSTDVVVVVVSSSFISMNAKDHFLRQALQSAGRPSVGRAGVRGGGGGRGGVVVAGGA